MQSRGCRGVRVGRGPGPLSARRLLLLFNPRAGVGRGVSADELLAEARAVDGAGARLVVLDGAPVEKVVSQHDPDASHVVIAAGGDGTVRSVAAAVAGRDRRFGVIPLGTRNHFARDAGLPLDVRRALAAIAHGRETRVDVGEVSGQVFLNNASLGLYPDFVAERRRRAGQGARWSAIAGAARFVLQQRRRLRVRVEDGPERRVSILFVGNNAYQLEGLFLGRRPALDAGVLTIVCAAPTGPWSAARLVARALLGRLREERDFRQTRTPAVRIDIPRRRVRVALDGDPVWLVPPLQFRIRPRALALIAPAAG